MSLNRIKGFKRMMDTQKEFEKQAAKPKAGKRPSFTGRR